MLEISYSWLETIIDVAIKSLLVGLLAGFTLAALRVRDTNVRHRVWTAVLVGMLAMPLLVLITPAAPLPAWMNVSWQPPSDAHATTEAVLSNEPPTSAFKDATRDQVAIAAPAPRDAPTFADADRALIEDFDGLATDPELSQLPSAAIRAMESDGIIVVPPTAEEPLAASVDSPRPWLSTHWPLILASTCVAVSTALLLRILVGLWVTVRLVRQSRPVDPYHVTRAESRNVQLLEHPQVYVPLTVEFVRPVVLLPPEWRTWNGEKLQAVLAHELAHVRRRDWLVTMLAELNRAIYWFHPLAWLLKRRLAALAEQCCDDAVLEANTGRAEYARYLLEVAASLTVSGRRCRAPLSSVAMARIPSVETRIDAILDSGRPLARRLSAIGAAVLLAVGIPAIILAAALRPADGEADFVAPAADSTEATRKEIADSSEARKADPPADKQDDAPKQITGHLIGPDGRTMAGCQIAVIGRLLQSHRGGDFSAVEPLLLASAATDTDGSFHIEAPQLSSSTHMWAAVVGREDGMRLAWQQLDLDSAEQSVDLNLRKEIEPLRVRFVTLEGHAAANVKVRLERVGPHAHGTFQGVHLPPKGDGLPLAVMATTDEDGWIEILGAGGQEVVLQINDEPYARQWPHIKGDATLEERIIPLPPSQIVFGQVRARDTGDPIPHARLTVSQGYDPNRGGMMVVDGQADASGRFRINPWPASSYTIRAFPSDGSPYVAVEKDYNWPKGKLEHEVDVEAPRGVLVRGRIVEDETGQPVAGATVKYEPQFITPVERPEGIVTGWQSIVTSNDAGEFSLAVPPGPGHLLVQAASLNYIRETVGSQMLYRGEPGGTRQYAHGVLRLDFPPDKEEHDATIKLRRGVTVRGTIRRPGGEPPSETLLLWTGQVSPSSTAFQPSRHGVRGTEFELHGVDPAALDVPVYFLDPKNKLGALVRVKGSDEAKPLTVTLQPTGTTVLRLVDAEGEPIADKDFQYGLHMVVTPGPSPMLAYGRESNDVFADEFILANWDRENHWDLKTDKEGRVRLEGLIPGATYRILGGSDGIFEVLHEFTLQSGQTFDLGTLQAGKDGSLILADEFSKKSKAVRDQTANPQIADAEPRTTLASEVASPQSRSAAESAEKQPPLVYEGLVLKPDGKPAAGAELHLVYWYSHANSSAAHNPVAQTASDGRFRFEMARDDFHRTGDSVPPWQWASLVAVAEGYGKAWAPSLAFEKTGAVVDEMREAGHPTAADPARLREMIDGPQGRLRLAADDLPIRGRVVDTEGQPVAGARVRAVEVYQGQDGTLDAWIEAAGEPRADFYSVRQTVPSHLYGPLAEKLFAPVETDDGGRFTIGGIGRERLVRLVIEAPHSEWADIYCRTRPGEPLAIGSGMADQTMKVHGPEFSHVAAPSKPVAGVVTDAQTGEPIPDVAVRSRETWMSTAPGTMVRGGNDFSRAVTDEAGRYELVGLPRSRRNHVEFIPPPGAAYLQRMTQVETQGTDVQPVTLDAELERGLVVAGRVVEAETGRGVSGRLTYLAATDKAGAGTLPALPMWSSQLSDERSDVEGHFEVVVPGGRGYLAFTAFSDIYEKNAARPEDASSPSPYYFAVGAGPEFHAIAKLDPADRVDRVRVEMEVTRGRVVTGRIVDADGNALEGGQYLGRSESSRWLPVADGEFVVNNYDPARPRRLAFVHREKRLAGTRVLEGELNDDLRVTLKPWGSVTGRVVNDQGDPIAGLLITAGSMQRMMRVMPSPAAGARADIDQIMPLPPGGDDPNARHLTDDDGRFRIEGLVPGETYELSGFEQTSFEARINGDIATGVVVELGQTLDLGDVTLQQPDFEALQREAEKQAEEARKEQVRQKDAADPSTNASRAPRARAVAAEQNAEHSTIHVAGKVLAPNGQPLAGARLYWPRTKTPEPRRLDDMYLQQVATSEHDGSFTAELKYPTTSWVREAPLFAVAEGFGMAWVDVSSSQTQDGLTLQLAEEFPISGRILTTEGSPVPGAAIGLYSVMADSSGSIDSLLTAWKSEWRSASMKVDETLHIGLHLVSEVLGNGPADEQGRFTIRGLGTEQAVWFTVSAPSIAKKTAIVITREGFDPAPYNDAALAQVANMALELRQLPKLFANELTIVAEAGKMITGKVTDIESGQPLEGVLVDTSAGYGDAIMATTDATGEYRLSGIPLFDDEILISFRKPHTRYLPRTLATRLSPGLAPMEFDAGLAKGVVLRGRVTETETGKPVAGGIRFAPFEDNAWKDKPGYDNYKRSRVMENVDQDGNFEFISIPGPGVLLMQAGRSGIEIGGRYVKPYRKGRFSEQDREKVRIYVEGESFYTSSNGLEFFENGMKVVEIPEDVQEYSANLTVDRGVDVDVAIVDDENQPLSGVIVCGVTESWPITYTIDEPRCTIYALDPERPRQVILYHPERKLAALLTLRGDEVQSPVARLVPTGTLVGRAVDADGQPLAAADVSLSWRDDTAREFQRQLDMTREVAATDDDGRFRLEGVFPGVYRLRFQQGEKRFRTDSLLEDATTVLAAAAGVGGREIQLGDVVVRPQ